MDRIIEIKVNGNYLTKDNQYAGTQGEANVTGLRIEFDEGWDGYAKTITWWDAKGENPTSCVLTTALLEDIVASTRIYLTLIPAAPLAVHGRCTFAIDGYINGKRQRSVYAELVVSPGPNGEDVEIEEPTPSQIEQLQAQIEGIMEDIQQASKGAASAEAAAKSAEEATASAHSASASEAAATAAQAAAEKARDEAKEIAGGDFPSRAEVEGYANTAEENAKSYAEERDAETLESANTYADEKVSETKPIYAIETMIASGWADGKYSFETEYPHEQYNISVEVAPTATAEQFEAFGGAMICGSADSNIATALGDVPTVDIPIIVKAVRK